MGVKFFNNLELEQASHVQFKTAAGANAGKIEQSGDDLLLTNATGDILLGSGSADVNIGDGTNNVDIRFEQSMAIFADSSSTRTLTLGGSNTNVVIESPTLNSVASMSASAANTGDIGASNLPFRNIYAAHHVGGNSINYATSRGWVVDGAPMSETQAGEFGGDFIRNGDDTENAVVYGLDPFGNKALLWKGVGQTSDDDDDGGFNKEITIPANNNIGYLSYVYWKIDFTPNESADGQFYHGCGQTSGQTLNLNGTSNTNPYFNAGALTNLLGTASGGSTVVANRWYVSVGVIQAHNNSTTDTDTISGIYDVETGEKVKNGSEYKMGNNTTGQKHRAYLYYQSSTSSGNMYFWNPGFHAIDGSEPKVGDLVKRFVSSGTVILSNLPTSDPTNAGQLWNDSGTLKISAG